MTTDIVLCMKINEKQWIEAIRDGSLCFNRVGYFIEQAEKTGNNEQGDKYEGVFARVKKTDGRIPAIRNKYADDLEIVDDDDDEYVLLRRKSSRNVPIFCAYGIPKTELSIEEGTIVKQDGEIHARAKYYFPEKMYKGFLDNTTNGINTSWGFYASSGHWYEAIEKALIEKKLRYSKQIISYDLDLSGDFFVEPNDTYSELFHKRCDLSYQHEVRYILPYNLTDTRLVIDYEPISEHCAGIAPGALYLEMNVICEPLPEKEIDK